MPGPFYFAWVTEGTAFDPNVHNVMDEEVFSFHIEQNEGDFPALELTIRNPRQGLLAPSRFRWAYLSYDKEWTPEGSYTSNIVPLFYGRLVGVPNDLQGEFLDLSFIARPIDYLEQKAAVAETKKVRPYWDPIWFTPEDLADPDNVLESRPELWHIDRVTHEVSTSNVINGEDGTINLGESDILWDGSSFSYGEVPLRQVSMSAKVSWDQNASGSISLSHLFYFGAFGSIYTYTGHGLIDEWPKSGAKLGGGWEVEFSSIVRVDGAWEPVWGYKIGALPNTEDPTNRIKLHHDFGPGTAEIICPTWYENVKYLLGSEFTTKILYVPRWQMIPALTARFDVTRKYSEVLNLLIEADVQDIVTDAGGEDYIDLSMASSEIASPIDPLGALPIGDVRRRTFFSTDRGEQSIEYLITMMRSRLLMRARAVEVSVQTDFNTGVDLDLSCRKNAVLTDYRLPGGAAAGKIKGYALELNGEDGTMLASLTIGCCVGFDGSIDAVAGTPSYVADGYVNSGYQQEIGGTVPIADDSIGYTSINGEEANDDGLNLLDVTVASAVDLATAQNTWQEQLAAMGTHADEPGIVFERVNLVPTRFGLTMHDFTGGPFETTFNVTTTLLKVPKQIDLEAEAVS